MKSAPVLVRPAAMPTKTLSLLTAAVVAAHLFLIVGTTQSLQATQRTARGDAQPFSTRSISMGPIQPPTTVAAIAPSTTAAKATAATTPAPRPKTASPSRVAAVNTDITTIGPVARAAPEFSAGPAGAQGEPVASTPDSAMAGNTTAESPGAAAPAAAASAAKIAEVAAPPANTARATSAASAPIAPASPQVAAAQPSQATPAAPAASTSPNTAFAVPASTRLKYNVIATEGSLSFNARAELLWLQDGSNYDARLEISAFLLGARIQTSTGRLTAEGLEPKRFADKFRSEVAAHFERDKRMVTFSANTPQVPLLAGMQDQLSVVMQLSAMVAGAPGQYAPGTEIAFNTIGPRSSENWVLTVGEEEKLSLPGGQLKALKFTRRPRGEYDQTLELWLAPQLAYLPARIKIIKKNGDYADQVWRATETP